MRVRRPIAPPGRPKDFDVHTSPRVAALKAGFLHVRNPL